ncbi:MAG TPA: purine-nucleoside phosphorylase [Candidatus Dormibacteraeota bacterium]|nr:purine-nucleoside phosphorylase [Candidatus Dormibacteraeota bacterium]
MIVRRPVVRGSDYAAAGKAANFVLSKTKLRSKIAVVLGSGLGSFADQLKDTTKIAYEKIPGFPRATAIGHAGKLIIGKVGKVPVVVMQGRVHLYEGHCARDVVFPMRVLRRMGIRSVILTNAAGGIGEGLRPGDLVLIQDHINLQGVNPLIGANDENWGPRFPDMTYAYSEKYRDIAKAAARKLGIELREGIYAALVGPSYETPAEIRYLKAIGADLVGMSTVAETIAARHAGMNVLGISCVTNMAAGLGGKALDHQEVLAVGQRVQNELGALLSAVIPEILAGDETAAANETARKHKPTASHGDAQ